MSMTNKDSNNISIFSEIEQRIITFSKKQTKFNNYISKAMNVLILYIGIDIIYIFSRTVEAKFKMH
jgi:hypothetical protein